MANIVAATGLRYETVRACRQALGFGGRNYGAIKSGPFNYLRTPGDEFLALPCPVPESERAALVAHVGFPPTQLVGPRELPPRMPSLAAVLAACGGSLPPDVELEP
ncbi:TPA: hypothetical protein ACOEOS_003205 [Stenotrophomonas maltophilia]